jgi:CheY-like chemotaxis protein
MFPSTSKIATDTVPPRVLIVMPDQWRRALIRAALREAGYDAVGARGLRQAQLVRASLPGRGPVRVIILDQEALIDTGGAALTGLTQQLGEVNSILVARATIRLPDGQWSRVLRRPVSVAEIVRAVEEVAPLRPEMKHAIDLT